MPTVDEEKQAAEFLKRAEIRTMRKDLHALREVDALKERDKIAKIKTLEEQLEEQTKAKTAALAQEAEKTERQEILEQNVGQEKIAEKDLKNYASEQERQQIFLFESQRLTLEKQVDAIDNEKDPAFKLEKNQVLLQIKSLKEKVGQISEEEKKVEAEEKAIIEREQTTNVPAERKSLEQSRWDLDQKIKNIEKRRWEVEKMVQDLEAKITQIDKDSEQLVAQKNGLRDKILGVDKSLREVYFAVMAREEEKKKGREQEQVVKKEALAKTRSEEKENVQREQWGGLVVPKKRAIPGIVKSFEAEEEQRKKFMQDVEEATKE